MTVLVTALTIIIICQFIVIIFLVTGRDEGTGKLSRSRYTAASRARSIGQNLQGYNASQKNLLLSRANAFQENLFLPSANGSRENLRLSRANAYNMYNSIESMPSLEASNTSLELFEGVAVTTFLGGPKVRIRNVDCSLLLSQ
jgi:hypothetical protein